MNLVGKIFVGIIALMSVVCLTATALSYASHHNWKGKHDDVQKKLTEAEQQKKQLNDQKAELNNKIASESQTYMSAIEALMTKVGALERENADLTAQNETLQKDLDARLAVIKTNNAQIDDLRNELDSASSNLADAQTLRAVYLRQLSDAIEKLHELAALNGDLSDQNKELVDSLANTETILNKMGLSPDVNDYEELPPFAVQGTIEDVDKSNDGLLMISIGSDDGLAKNNLLDVKRGDSYLGKIQVVTVEPNRAVCQVLPEFRQGVMMKGDNVYANKAN